MQQCSRNISNKEHSAITTDTYRTLSGQPSAPDPVPSPVRSSNRNPLRMPPHFGRCQPMCGRPAHRDWPAASSNWPAIGRRPVRLRGVNRRTPWRIWYERFRMQMSPDMRAICKSIVCSSVYGSRKSLRYAASESL